MAHYYHYYFIFPPLQRGPETTEKQKINEININKSSGHRNGQPTGKISEDGKNDREKRGMSEEGKKGRHKYKKRKRIRGKGREESKMR
jgi:hypothetical protein